MEIRIEIKDGLAGCAFYKKEAQVQWEDLTIEEKDVIVGSLANLTKLFANCIDIEDDKND